VVYLRSAGLLTCGRVACWWGMNKWLVVLLFVALLPVPYLLLVANERLEKSRPQLHKLIVSVVQIVGLVVLVIALMVKCSGPMDVDPRPAAW